MEQLYTLTENREQESVAAWVKKRWRDALGNPRGTVARKWVLPTAEKQPIENVGVGVGASGQSTCLTCGALGPICSTTKMKVILGVWLAFPCQTWCKTTLTTVSSLMM